MAIDLFCGLGGWTDGLLAEGYDVIGFDIERHEYGDHRYPSQLVLQDVLTLHGRQFKDADLIVASPPCQFFSYTAMPWSRAKALAAEVRADPVRLEEELALFRACFRIQREACEAAGCHIPMVVENVRGAEAWVGRAAAKYGSFYFWGDVPALMPSARVPKRADRNFHTHRLTGGAVSSPSFNGGDHETRGRKTTGHVNKRDGYSHTRHLTNQAESDGVKMRDADGYERNHPAAFKWKSPRTSSGNTSARKAASAMIAKIPLPLARWIGHAWKPERADEPACRTRASR